MDLKTPQFSGPTLILTTIKQSNYRYNPEGYKQLMLWTVSVLGERQKFKETRTTSWRTTEVPEVLFISVKYVETSWAIGESTTIFWIYAKLCK